MNISPVTGTADAPARNGERRRLAVAAAIGFLVIASFELALLAGAPFGEAAFGGADPGQLSAELRAASAVSAVVWLLAAVIVLTRGGFAILPISASASRWGTWALVALMGLGSVMNFASPSPWERFGWGPVALILLVLCVLLARRATSPRGPEQ